MRTRVLGFGLLVLALAAAACSQSSDPVSNPVSPTAVQNQVGTPPGGGDGDDVFGATAPGSYSTIEGVVTLVRGVCPNLGLQVGQQMVRTYSRTAFEGQRCTAIAVRDRVVVTGRPTSGDLFGAVRVVSRKP